MGIDSEEPARVERFEIVRRSADIQQNAANQKAGEHEKQIHACPAKREKMFHKNVSSADDAGSVVLRARIKIERVKHHDQCDCDSPQTVKFRDSRGLLRR